MLSRVQRIRRDPTIRQRDRSSRADGGCRRREQRRTSGCWPTGPSRRSGRCSISTAVFGRRADVVLDIGFGGGEATIELARAARPGRAGDRRPHAGVGRLLESIERDQLTNVRVIDGDALVFVERIPAAVLHEIRILFPDPWPKVRQRHRRLVRADVVATLTDRLVPGGTLHIATDVADYAAQVLAVCSAEPRLAGGIVERPVGRTITRFEQRGVDAGRRGRRSRRSPGGEPVRRRSRSPQINRALILGEHVEATRRSGRLSSRASRRRAGGNGWQGRRRRCGASPASPRVCRGTAAARSWPATSDRPRACSRTRGARSASRRPAAA